MTLGEYIGAGSGVTKGLWHLNGNSNDTSGNSKNGTDTAITYSSANGKLGSQGAGFNGTTSKISFGTSILTAATGTISTWLYPTDVATNHRRAWSDSAGYIYLTIGEGASGRLRLNIFDSSNHTIDSTITANVWSNVICTWNSTTAFLYVNGVSVGSVGCGALGSITGTFWMGTASASNFYQGNQDEMILENVAWSATKIQKYYTFAKGRF